MVDFQYNILVKFQEIRKKTHAVLTKRLLGRLRIIVLSIYITITFKSSVILSNLSRILKIEQNLKESIFLF